MCGLSKITVSAHRNEESAGSTNWIIVQGFTAEDKGSGRASDIRNLARNMSILQGKKTGDGVWILNMEIKKKM